MGLSDIISEALDTVWCGIEQYEYFGTEPPETLILALAYMTRALTEMDIPPGFPVPRIDEFMKIVTNKWIHGRDVELVAEIVDGGLDALVLSSASSSTQNETAVATAGEKQ